jgi:hypothetical protein
MRLLDCDWCEENFLFEDMYNVNYNDGYANVLCPNCVDEAQKDCADRIESVWK